MKAVPYVLEQYDFHWLTEDECKTNIAKHFKKYKAVDNPVVIDMLRVKGEMELDETIRRFKTPCHILYLLNTDIDDPQSIEEKSSRKEYMKIGGSDFMADFLQGK
eukprot:CAMPEP_0170172974 /NCGR_PEP_ID=MMETSP0040_2-20121228/6245_1 /TAXON_ID=641309 /ORGANISM="Lotharella oceanica, Strain CCMP622" /LENGTH=104 /DNA_ID=CAMNT_0010413915 /DNA_START=133 /DNA_END=447 /DNA_ORIENTATION=+